MEKLQQNRSFHTNAKAKNFTIEELKEGVELTKQTKGYFNIFMGNIIDYYKTFLIHLVINNKILLLLHL